MRAAGQDPAEHDRIVFQGVGALGRGDDGVELADIVDLDQVGAQPADEGVVARPADQGVVAVAAAPHRSIDAGQAPMIRMDRCPSGPTSS